MSGPDPDSYDAVLRRGRSALAWEVLRRDPAYRDAYDRLAVRGAAHAPADSDFVARWGVHFP